MHITKHPDFLGIHHPERPLPPGSVVNNQDMLAKVLSDDGGEIIYVDYEGKREEWFWDLAGIVMTVEVVNNDNQDVSEMEPETIIELAKQQAAKKPSFTI